MKNKIVIASVAILALLVILALVWRNQNKVITPVIDTNTATSTATTTNTIPTPPVVVAPTPGVPIVQTSANSSRTDTTAFVTGTVVPNYAFTTYWYEYGVTTNLGSKTANQSVGSGYNTLNAPAYITNLNKNTTFYFRLVAENQYGRTTGSTFTFTTTTGTPLPVGSAPKVLTIAANNISHNGAKLNGQVTPNQSETKYWFEYGTTNNLGFISDFASAGNTGNSMATSITITNLSPNTTYYFRLNAQNQFSTVNGAILTFRTLGPVAVALPIVTTGTTSGLSTSSVTLRGTVSPNGVETKYWFEYSTDTLMRTALLAETAHETTTATNKTSVSVDVSSLKPKTVYYYHIVAQNETGISLGSRGTFTTK